MRKQVVIGLLALSMVAGCGKARESRFNPLNWFSKSEPVAAAQTTVDGRTVVVLPTLAPRKGYIEFVDGRPLVAAITALRIDKMPSGGIVVASGQVGAKGFYDIELVPAQSDRPDRLVFDFRARPAQDPTAGQTRVEAARSLSNEELAGIREIIVRAQNGARSVRR